MTQFTVETKVPKCRDMEDRRAAGQTWPFSPRLPFGGAKLGLNAEISLKGQGQNHIHLTPTHHYAI